MTRLEQTDAQLGMVQVGCRKRGCMGRDPHQDRGVRTQANRWPAALVDERVLVVHLGFGRVVVHRTTQAAQAAQAKGWRLGSGCFAGRFDTMACTGLRQGQGRRSVIGTPGLPSPPIVSGSIVKLKLIRAPVGRCAPRLPIHSLWASQFLTRPGFGPQQSRRAWKPIQHMSSSGPTTDNGNLEGIQTFLSRPDRPPCLFWTTRAPNARLVSRTMVIIDS
ncbi:hypothetical protein CLCR_01316 [Cladophialophora carrionii]|uniref:Uncharacterized protein n=1 Tax=Cladophialophora carrionii TaxID=86049 RepID=A0A1C1CCF6_9EURO|nr:hypothetical protein CLCR_01316 [Cladophialophora carrionii]